MGKTVRHNKHGKKYQERESAGVGYETNLRDSRGMTVVKKSDKLHGVYGKTIYGGGYPYERDSQSDRFKRVKHIQGKLLRRGLQREANKIIDSEL